MAASGERQQRSAVVIQKAWRRHLFRTVFGFYKELIGRCNRGDPQTILRTVNPREAELLDAAAGVFIRFRFGGTVFPPSIYYKIFTYRPVADLCASSPRSYANANRRQSETPPDNQTDMERSGKTGWYQRYENNNWRLFTSALVPKPDSAEGDDDTKVDVGSVKLQRRQDVLRWRQKKKIQWLKQMYRRGRLEETVGQVASLVDKSTQDVVKRLETDSQDIMEWELDELLAWSDTLNFEEYMTQWRRLACSQSSEMSFGPFHHVRLATEHN